MFIPSHKRFELNPNTMCFERRYIQNDYVYCISVPQSNWSKTLSYNVNYWLKREDSIERPFPYGKIIKEELTTTDMILHNTCSFCGKSLKNINTLRRHMSICKHKSSATNIIDTKKEEMADIHAKEATPPVNVRDKSGIVYLIQPGSVLGLGRYKIGCSRSCTISRVNTYGKNTKILMVLKVQKPYEAETFILNEITKTYVPYHGREWFQCDEDTLSKMFLDTYIKYQLHN